MPQVFQPAFHPAVNRWLERAFEAPTPAQEQAWPAIQAGRHTLIAAPTGSGKTLAAFLAAIDRLVREALERGGLRDETYIVYVSPLKALSNDIRRNLEAPLAGIRGELRAMELPDIEIRTFVRTGDTPQHERQSMRRRPPHIVVTTPESLYILLGSESGRAMLTSVRSVIVDEIHAMVGSKRGLHLALSLERLEALAGRRLTRIGLSATQRPIREVARFLVGTRQLRADGQADCAIVDIGHVRRRDLQIEVPAAPLEAVMSGDVWTQVYDRLAQLAGEHRTTLIFVNTRRHAERVARHLSERMGETLVAAHHGSLAKELRFAAESRLKRGELKALVATASLELGIDIGDVDLVCQLGSPRSIAALLQRVGRSGHSLGGTPKGRLFPLSRDDLIECAALLDCVRRGELDRLRIPAKPLDVLAQQIVAEVAAREWDLDELFALLRRAYPYRDLLRAELDDVIRMLADGFTTRRGRRGALIHFDAVNGKVRGRRGARLTALTSGGTIPDTADYTVLLEPQSQPIGTINEDFAIESMQGDVFQLGNSSYRILRVERSTVRVEDAHGQPPSIPFWLGEAPGRSDELSQGVSRLRAEIGRRLDDGLEAAVRWLQNEVGIAGPAAVQAVGHLAAARAALGALPSPAEKVVLERFFDEAGGMFSARHPLALRQPREPRLGTGAAQALLPLLQLRAAGGGDRGCHRAVAHHRAQLRARGGGALSSFQHGAAAAGAGAVRRADVPGALALERDDRARAAAVSRRPKSPRAARAHGGGRPARLCVSRPGGLRRESLRRARDPRSSAGPPGDPRLSGGGDGHRRIRGAAARTGERRAVTVVARDLTEPSPLALEVLSARPYAFLDDAPLEERRTQAVLSRRWLDPGSCRGPRRPRIQPPSPVRARKPWPDAADADDELHDALCWLTFMTEVLEMAKRARTGQDGPPASPPAAGLPA